MTETRQKRPIKCTNIKSSTRGLHIQSWIRRRTTEAAEIGGQTKDIGWERDIGMKKGDNKLERGSGFEKVNDMCVIIIYNIFLL